MRENNGLPAPAILTVDLIHLNLNTHLYRLHLIALPLFHEEATRQSRIRPVYGSYAAHHDGAENRDPRAGRREKRETVRPQEARSET